MGSLDDEVYHTPVRGGEFLGRVFAEGREVGDLDQAHPIGPELAPYPLGYLLRRSLGVDGPRHGGAEHEARGEDKVYARPGDYAEQVEDGVVRKRVRDVLHQRVPDGEVGPDAHDRHGIGEHTAQEEVDPTRVPDVAPRERVVEQEVAQDGETYGEHPGDDLVRVENLCEHDEGDHVDKHTRGSNQGEFPE